ncbi:MAG: hypothetical protein LBF88_02350 [Planctomycetaceae bacterium]|nr:hypothetical protein [Planctomycetaceae bacterium]
MKIAGEYSFNNGKEIVQTKYPNLLNEIREVIAVVDALGCKTKTSKEKTMTDKLLFSPRKLNKYFKKFFF